MAYSRPPQIIRANGGALLQNPAPTDITPPGLLPVELEVKISSTTNLGVVQVGSGLAITPAGMLSTTGGAGGGFVNVTLVDKDYTVTESDYYIGATDNDIDITLPLGQLGKVYVVKNQVSGNILVKGTSGQKIDISSSKTLGTNDSLEVVFDGTRWNVIN
jgi:hypothetical protein